MAALDMALEISATQRAAVLAERAAYDRQREAETAANLARREAEAAAEAGKAASADLLNLLRALANRAETEPREIVQRDAWARSPEYAATFAHGYVQARSTSGGYSAHAPKAVRAYLFPHGASASDAIDVYDSGRGTRDAGKLAAYTQEATAALLAALRPYTAAAWLAARGIDPATAPDPAAILECRPMVGRRSDWWQGNRTEYWQVTWHVALTGSPELVPGIEIRNGWDLAEARADAAAGGRGRASYDARREAQAGLNQPGDDASREAVEEWAASMAPEALRLIVARYFGPFDD
jgi:hypothetical protein